VLAAALAAALLVLAMLTIPRLSATSITLVGGGADGSVASGGDPGAAPVALEDTPSVRTQLAFLRLDDPLDRALSVLGPPDRREPDLNATHTHVWALPGGAELAVSADELGIVGLYGYVPPGSPVRLRAFGSVVVGLSTPGQVAAAWGPAHDLAASDTDDYVLRYTTCAGPFPVVVKFDQDGPAPGAQWNQPISSVFIAYADADPGSHGCEGPPPG
jgi:hypothetical protein